MLNQAVRWRYIQENPALAVANPKPQRAEINPFARVEVEAIMAELAPSDALFVRVLADSGLRPGEAIALEHRDVDLDRRLIHVNRQYSKGRLVEMPKNGARRSVPIRQRLLDALQTAPRRIDTRLVLPGMRGGYRDLGNWRNRQWRDALDALDGVEYRQPYALRHTFATESINAGIPLFVVARRMGTSLRMIEQTYGHLDRGSDAYEIDLLDAYDQRLDAERTPMDASGPPVLA